MRNFNLYLACFWGLLGLGLIFYVERLDGQAESTRTTWGYLALGLSFYNMVRWYLTRMQERVKRDAELPTIRRTPRGKQDPTFEIKDEDEAK